jgi:hypothetical protein
MHLFMTADLKEIMAKRPKRKEVKQQWRLPIHQIRDIKTDYKDKLQYNQSAFAKSGGLFKKSKYFIYAKSIYIGITYIISQSFFNF